MLARLKFGRTFMMESLNSLLSKAFALKCSVKKVFIKISQIHRKTTVLEFLFNKVDASFTVFYILFEQNNPVTNNLNDKHISV